MVPSGVTVFVNASGQLGTSTSSARFKDEIKPMDKASEIILALKPVTFRYKKELDPERIPQFGLVAEDVAKVNPDLVIYDPEGKLYTVRYDAVNAMLLNEFLKQHRKVEQLETAAAQQAEENAGFACGSEGPGCANRKDKWATRNEQTDSAGGRQEVKSRSESAEAICNESPRRSAPATQ